MKYARRLTLSVALAFAFLQAPAFSAEARKDVVTQEKPAGSPFAIKCQDSGLFASKLKRLKAKGLMVGTDADDGSLIMAYRFPDDSVVFARSRSEGGTVCIFGAVAAPDFNLSVVLQSGEAREITN